MAKPQILVDIEGLKSQVGTGTLTTTSKNIIGAIIEHQTAIVSITQNKLSTTGNGKDLTVTFTEAFTDANIVSDEKLSITLGKILKRNNVVTNNINNIVSGVTIVGKAALATTSENCTGNSATSSSCTGNSATATKLKTAITIDGIDFDGSINIITPVATAGNSGKMSAEDKAKLDTIATNANYYQHPSTHQATIIVEDATHRFVTDVEKLSYADKYTKTEVDNLFASLEMDIIWKAAVQTYADIATAYPSPVKGWTVNVNDTYSTYRYDGAAWVLTSTNAILKATITTDGLMSSDDKIKLNAIAIGATVNSTDAFLLSRANHTGTQTASTISDFSTAVRATTLSGLSTASTAVIASTDTVLGSLGKLQGQVSSQSSTLALKAPLANPDLTGIPTTPTASVGTNTTQIASTKFVNDSVASAFSSRIIKGTGTLPTADWATIAGAYIYRYSFSIAGVLATDVIDISINPQSQDTALSIEMCPTSESYAGGVYFYAKSIPISTIPFSYIIFR